MRALIEKIGTPDGAFHDGNLASGELGTIVTALWLNAMQDAARSVQSELLAILSAVGASPNPDKSDQVWTAIKQLVGHNSVDDPHPQYTTDQEVAAAIDARTNTAGFAKKGDANAWTKGQSGTVSPLPATTGTVTLDLSQANNWDGTLSGNITLANPASMPVGQSGVIRISQGATPYVIAYGSVWKGANGILPGLTATANAVDVLGYYVESATRITLVAQGDVK